MSMHPGSIALLLIAAAPACQQLETTGRAEAPADTAAGEVPFDLTAPGATALVVPVYLNGEGPFDFVLDTGATITCVGAEVAQRLELPRTRGVIGVGAGIGGAGQMELVNLDSLRIGQASVEDLTACSLDLRHTGSVGLEIDGLLGLNFLRAFRVTIDFDREVVLFQAPD